MKFEGVLVRPLAAQGDRDGNLIDPAGISFEDKPVTIWRNFSYELGDLLGEGVISRAEDGSLVVSGELNEAGTEMVRGGLDRLAVGLRVDRMVRKRRGKQIASASTVFGIALTREHQDPDQPPVRLLDQWN